MKITIGLKAPVAAMLVLVAAVEAKSPVLPSLTTSFPRGHRAFHTPATKRANAAAEWRHFLELRGGAAKAPAKKAASRKPASGGGTASISNEIFNLVKGIVGAGVLSLPAGVAAFGDSPSAVIPALALIAAIGISSAFGFAIIGKVCAYTGAKSYGEAWSLSVGDATSWLPSWSATAMTFSACLAYSMILADTFGALLRRTHQRTAVLLGITVIILLPLCWMKSLASLAPFSLLGVLGMAYTAVAMAVRYLDQSYKLPAAAVKGAAPDLGSSLLQSLADDLKPSFGNSGWKSVAQPASLILVCMLSTAYMAHFNAPKFYLELRNNTLPRFHAVVASSFGISILLMGFITAVGFLTFGKSCSGLILNNYAASDAWMSASRIAVAVSLVFSYPLAFQAFRDGMLNIVHGPATEKQPRKDATINVMTIILLSVLTLLAATLKDVSFVMAFGGATLGNALIYVFPFVMYSAVCRKQERKEESFQVFLAGLSACAGIAMGAIGAKMSLDNA